LKIKNLKVENIRTSVNKCSLCEHLNDSGALSISKKEIGLNYIYPQETPINIFFIAESPPRPGNGFFYDPAAINTRFRDKLFDLLNRSCCGPIDNLEDFNNKGYYLADAINCRWDKSIKRNLPNRVFFNCSIYLSLQLELFKPKYIVAMGNSARNSLRFENVQRSIEILDIPESNIVGISFILVASNETDAQRIEKLKPICESLFRHNDQRNCKR